MNALPRKEALTNELAIRRFTRILNKGMCIPEVFDLSNVSYRLESYEEHEDDQRVRIFLKFTTDVHLSVILEMSGPAEDNIVLDFGIFLNPEMAIVERIGEEHIVILKGYLKPA
jgi:hypothetical protein